MKKISKETEEKLLSAVEKTAALVGTGDDPNAAIIKAAGEIGATPGQIALLVHAFNTGRTTKQRTSSDDVFEKIADFPLADAASILETLYPAEVKTAAARQRETAVSLEYSLPPDGLLARKRAADMRARQVDWSMVADPPPPYPGDPLARVKRAACTAEREERAVEEVRRQASEAFDKMAAVFCDLTDYFRRPGCTPMPAVREQARLLHGGRADAVLDQLTAVTPALAKLANHAMTPTGREPAIGPAFELVAAMIENIDGYRAARSRHEKMAAAAAARVEELLRPFAEGPTSALDDTPFFSRGKAGAVPPWLAAIGGAAAVPAVKGVRDMASSIMPADQQALTQSAMADLSDPVHMGNLRHVGAQAMLQRFMQTDPVISGYDPDDVSDAFNAVTQVSPRAADQEMLMQALLRKYLTQGQLDPFDTEQLLKMELQLQERDAPPSASKSVLESSA